MACLGQSTHNTVSVSKHTVFAAALGSARGVCALYLSAPPCEASLTCPLAPLPPRSEPEPSPGLLPLHLIEPMKRSFQQDHYVEDEGEIVFCERRRCCR